MPAINTYIFNIVLNAGLFSAVNPFDEVRGNAINNAFQLGDINSRWPLAVAYKPLYIRLAAGLFHREFPAGEGHLWPLLYNDCP